MKKILFWIAGSIIGIVFLLYGLLQFVNLRTYQLFGEIIPRVQTDRKVVSLTFDDAPAEGTEEVLNILDQENVKATFFLVGENIAKQPEVAKTIVNRGHEVGNHSYTHKRMVFRSLSFVTQEVEKTDELIRESGYKHEILFRPPYGKKLITLPWYMKEHNRKTIMWDIEPESYSEIAGNTDNIVRYVMDNTKPGSIIILHPFFKNEETRKALPIIIQKLRDEGYMFVTVSELLQYQQ